MRLTAEDVNNMRTHLDTLHAKCAALEAELAEARKDGERRRMALEEILDALGALSNPSELAGWAIGDERAAEIIELSRGAK